jgi:hypothetical protein
VEKLQWEALSSNPSTVEIEKILKVFNNKD